MRTVVMRTGLMLRSQTRWRCCRMGLNYIKTCLSISGYWRNTVEQQFGKHGDETDRNCQPPSVFGSLISCSCVKHEEPSRSLVPESQRRRPACIIAAQAEGAHKGLLTAPLMRTGAERRSINTNASARHLRVQLVNKGPMMEQISAETLLGLVTTPSPVNSFTANSGVESVSWRGNWRAAFWWRFSRLTTMLAVSPDYSQQVSLLHSFAVNRFRLKTSHALISGVLFIMAALSGAQSLQRKASLSSLP